MDVSLRSAKPVRQRFLVVVHFIGFSLAQQHDRSDKSVLVRPGGLSGLGVCTYGRSSSCCLGWRNVNGVCRPMCKNACFNGECVGPDKCSCAGGYTGQLCDQDVNECGLAERPCSQSCMNTPGSYRCHCDPGYTLRADRHTCTREAQCSSARCQFECQMEGGGEVRCLCPPGLHLAEDNRTCEDVDECLASSHVCPPQQTCRNTFGSFVCVCRDGFVLGTLQNAVQCRDKNECVTGTHRCSRHSLCINTDGSYTCRCTEDYWGDGHTCWPRRAPQSMATLYFQYKLAKRTQPMQPSL